MTVGFAAAEANAILSSFDGEFVQLHTGDPGAAGTANVAAETDRVALPLGTPAGGVVTNDAALEWSGVGGAEDYTHLSVWTDAVGGTFRFSGLMTANAVSIGDNFVIPVGDFDISIPVAS